MEYGIGSYLFMFVGILMLAISGVNRYMSRKARSREALLKWK